MGELVLIILIVAGFLVISYFIAEAYSKASDQEREVICRQSVQFAAETTLNIQNDLVEMRVASPLCRTIDREISGTKEELLQEIADSTARCWRMFHEGSYDEIVEGFTSSLFPNVQNQCFICYTVSIDEDTIDGSSKGISPQELVQYLLQTEYKPGTTYLNYLQANGRGQFAYLVTDEQGNALPILPRHRYAISFAPKLKEVEDSTLWTGITRYVGGNALTAGALVIGVTTGGVGWVAVAAGAILGQLIAYRSWDAIIAGFYGERVISSIYVDTLQSAQQHCMSDLAGMR